MQLKVSLRWMYTQFIAPDANLKLKLKNRHVNDPELGSGQSYFVEELTYVQHVANSQHDHDEEVSYVLHKDLF